MSTSERFRAVRTDRGWAVQDSETGQLESTRFGRRPSRKNIEAAGRIIAGRAVESSLSLGRKPTLEEQAFLGRLEKLGLEEQRNGPGILDRFAAIGWPRWQLLHFFRNYTAPNLAAEQRREIRRRLPKMRAAARTLRDLHALFESSTVPLSRAAELLDEIERHAPPAPAHAPIKDRQRRLRLVFAWTTRQNTDGRPHDRLGWVFYRALFDLKDPRELSGYIRRRQEDEKIDSSLKRMLDRAAKVDEQARATRKAKRLLSH